MNVEFVRTGGDAAATGDRVAARRVRGEDAAARGAAEGEGLGIAQREAATGGERERVRSRGECACIAAGVAVERNGGGCRDVRTRGAIGEDHARGADAEEGRCIEGDVARADCRDVSVRLDAVAAHRFTHKEPSGAAGDVDRRRVEHGRSAHRTPGVALQVDESRHDFRCGQRSVVGSRRGARRREGDCARRVARVVGQRPRLDLLVGLPAGHKRALETGVGDHAFIDHTDARRQSRAEAGCLIDDTRQSVARECAARVRERDERAKARAGCDGDDVLTATGNEGKELLAAVRPGIADQSNRATAAAREAVRVIVVPVRRVRAGVVVVQDAAVAHVQRAATRTRAA